jgi:formate C-acetyltransferase
MAEIFAIDLTISSSARISLLRSRCLERKKFLIPTWPEEPRLAAQSLRNSESVPSWQVRRGLLSRDRLAGLPLEVDDLELLVGRVAPDRPEWQEERQSAAAFLRAHYPHLYPPGQTGHCQLDLTRLFSLGIDGLAGEIRSRMEPSSGARRDVYLSFLYALEGLAQLAENAGRAAALAALHSSQDRQYELAEMAETCRRIAHHPPGTFREALQLLWLAVLGSQWGDHIGLVNPGRLDRTLWPFYQADIAAGRLSRENALLLIESLYLLLNESIPDGLAISVMVGGRDAAGQDVTNDLSYLCLEAARRTDLIYPTVGICWHAGTPEALMDLGTELVAQGFKQPAFFNDETIQRGLQQYGVPPAEACDYINSTCVEITPCGSSNVWVASPYFSTCKILLDEIEDQAAAENPAPSFEAFLAAYRGRLARQIDAAVQENNADRRLRQETGGKPLQSLFTRDCLERGHDIDDGGARYNWVECSFVGLANLIDSLHVIREEVFSSRRMDLQTLQGILKSNFQGHEKMRQRFLRGHPKYGNDCPPVDGLMRTVIGFIAEECARQRMEPDGSPFVPGAFCWIMHERLGRECGATPDGRVAGFPFADGCGAAQGRELHGPTAAVLSVTSWDPGALIGGAAFNMRFKKDLFASAEALPKLKYLILTFLRRGGFETQINVLDADTLRQAQKDPENYQDLIVRIGGYSDYFTRLSPQMQAEVILRTEYDRM